MRRRRSLGGGFSPRKLFADGTVGAWYDPSDYSTLFQDPAGTTPVTTVEQLVRLMRDKSGNGNHALAPDDDSRPILRARYNLLTYSEQFDNAAWTKAGVQAFGSGSVVNATTAPDGTTTADKIVEDAVLQPHYIAQSVTTSATIYAYSVYLKAAERSFALLWNATANFGRVFDLSTGTVSGTVAGVTQATATIDNAGNGWYRCTIYGTCTAASNSFRVYVMTNATTFNYTGNGTSGLYIWGADLRTGSSAGTYQRIAAATDYATAGFLPYLYFVTDDSFGTNSINFSATDKMSVCVGITKLSDAAAGTLVELTADATANNGGFALRAPDSATSNYGAITRGTVASNTRLATTYVSPITNVLTILLNNGGALSADQIAVRINAQTPTLSAGTATTTGNFANAAMYIGRRNNATVPFNGRIYGLIVAGKTLSASELSATEAWMNSKTRAY